MATKGRAGGAKTGGRQKGTPNRQTTELRGFIEDLINDNREQLALDFAMLDGKERLQMFEKLAAYLIPKQASNQTKLDIQTMTEADLDQLIKKL